MTPYDKAQLDRIGQQYSGPAYGGKIDIADVHKLVYMAERDICPDGTWSDAACDLWSKFRYLMRHKFE